MQTMNEELDAIQKEFEKAEQLSCVPVALRKVKPDFVFDEEQSVRWNREKVTQNNIAYEREVARLNSEKNKARDKAITHLCDFISKNSGMKLTKEKSRRVFDFISKWDNSHSCYHRNMSMVLDMVIMLNSISRKEEK